MIDPGFQENTGENGEEPARPHVVFEPLLAASVAESFTFVADEESWSRMGASGWWSGGNDEHRDRFLRTCALRLCGSVALDPASAGAGQLTLPDGRQFRWTVHPAAIDGAAANPQHHGTAPE